MEGDDEDDDDEVGDEDKTQNLDYPSPALVGNNRVYRGWGILVSNTN